jgi:hypothetical protein
VAPPKEVVTDEFIGYLFALVHDNLTIDATGAELMEMFPEYLDDNETPMDFIAQFRRVSNAQERFVELDFTRAFRYPAPIDILGYRPVHLASSETLRFREQSFVLDHEGGLTQAIVLVREEGMFSVDFAPWLDFLLGSLVDDVAVEIVLAAEYEDRWYGAMAGYNPTGDIVTSVYDMPRGRFRASPPRPVSEYAIERLMQMAQPQN